MPGNGSQVAYAKGDLLGGAQQLGLRQPATRPTRGDSSHLPDLMAPELVRPLPADGIGSVNRRAAGRGDGCGLIGICAQRHEWFPGASSSRPGRSPIRPSPRASVAAATAYPCRTCLWSVSGGVENGRVHAIAMGLPIAWEGPLAPHHPFGTLSQAWWASSALRVKAAATIAFLVGKGREGSGEVRLRDTGTLGLRLDRGAAPALERELGDRSTGMAPSRLSCLLIRPVPPCRRAPVSSV